MRSFRSILAGVVTAACLGISVAATAEVYYTINGQPAPYNVAMYMAANNLPPGNYWLNQQGWWGIVGNPQPLGNIYAAANQQQRHPSLSERGMLYRPGEILNGD
jgi:hypothetical protein